MAPRFIPMKRDWMLITLPTIIAVTLLISLAPVRQAQSQEDRRPCVSPGSPEGCVPLTRAPSSGPSVTSNPDAPGVVPVSEWPVAKKPKTMPEDWQVSPDYLPKDGTVTVSPAPPDEQPKPE